MLIQSILINLGFLGLDFRDRLSRPALASPPLVAFAASSLRGRERLVATSPILRPINIILRRRGCVNTQFPTTLAFSSSPTMALTTTGLLRSDNVLAMVTSPAVSIFFFDHFLTLLRRMTPHLSFSSTPLLALGIATTFLHLRPLLSTNAHPRILHSINPTMFIGINDEQIEVSATKSIIVRLFRLATVNDLTKRSATFIPQHHIGNLYSSIIRYIRLPRPRLLSISPAMALAATD
mmetsp:Transcript_27750/g.47151  ORF Transcript_27750/g.47151 Transcript_27750/m.47151 type:complete len:236 (-) Transcript_27750:644-1351(-)